jgi:hypothetical protein
MMKKYFIPVFLGVAANIWAQPPWPSQSWNAAQNLTSVMDTEGILELSGLHWNPDLQRLFAVEGDGRLHVLQLSADGLSFSEIADKAVPDGPEGITQVDFAASEFYTIDENNYEIRRFSYTGNFSNIGMEHSWNLTAAPSPMEDTGNTGPEGIAFIPDASLAAAGFVDATGNTYTSVKGMGGLMFIAHQDGGYIWVFDINPDVDDDFAFVGKYKSNRAESCDLAFDRSTGLLYMLHSTSANRIEVTDLTSSIVADERKLTKIAEYLVAVPDGDTNVEGFALAPKCPETGAVSAWLCRDIEDGGEELTDVLRWFSPFASDGACALSNAGFVQTGLRISPNPVGDVLVVDAPSMPFSNLRIYDLSGKVLVQTAAPSGTVDVSRLSGGSYILEIESGGETRHTKFIKR